MSETAEAETEDETGAESQNETAETSQDSTHSTGGGSDGGVDLNAYLNFSEAEKESLVDWVVYIAGLFGAIGFAQGLNIIIQNRWDHDLVFAGPGFRNPAVLNPRAMLTIGLFVVPLLGILFALKVGHEEETPVKVAAATSLVAMVVLGAVSGLVGTVPPGGISINLVNTIVSSIGAGIAAAVGSVIVVFLTQEFAPDVLKS